jgi:hypothetical protein
MWKGFRWRFQKISIFLDCRHSRSYHICLQVGKNVKNSFLLWNDDIISNWLYVEGRASYVFLSPWRAINFLEKNSLCKHEGWHCILCLFYFFLKRNKIGYLNLNEQVIKITLWPKCCSFPNYRISMSFTFISFQLLS